MKMLSGRTKIFLLFISESRQKKVSVDSDNFFHVYLMLEIRLIFNSVAPSSQLTSLLSQYKTTVKLDFNELLNKEQIDFKELFTDYQLFYTINLLLNKELLPI